MAVCSHMASVHYSAVAKKAADPSTWICDACDSNTESVWMCLTCANVGCGRTCRQRHAIRHHLDSGHPLALHLNHKMLYCYLCEDWALNDTHLGEVDLLRSTLGSLQDQVIAKSTTRAGSVIHASAPVFHFVDRGGRYEQSDHTFTAQKHYETTLCRTVFRAWAAIPGPSKNRRLFIGRTGLRNIGNSCYQNATLTCLSSLKVVREFLQRLPDISDSTICTANSSRCSIFSLSRRQSEQFYAETQKKRPSRTSAMYRQPLDPKHLSVLAQLYRLFRMLWSGKWAGITPMTFVRTFVSAVPQFRGYQQHDAHEFLMSLLDRLHEELQLFSPTHSPMPAPNNKSPLIGTDSQEKEPNSCSMSSSEPAAKAPRSDSVGHSGSVGELHASSLMCSGKESVMDAPTWLRSFIRTHFESRQVSNTRCHRCKVTSRYAFPGARAITLDLPVTIERIKTEKQRMTVSDDQFRGRSRSSSSVLDSSQARAWPRRRTTRQSCGVTALSLRELLSDLVAPTHLHDSCQYRCDKCNCMTDATKSDAFQYLATVVVFHVNRTSWDSHGKRKLTQRIDYPLRGLDLSVLMTSRCAADELDLPAIGAKRTRTMTEEQAVPHSCLYNLRAVVLHHGKDIDQGHYTSLCYDDTISSWVAFNDIKAHLVSESEVLRPKGQSYLLFYERA